MRRIRIKPELPDELAKLYRHLNQCRICAIAIKASDPREMCRAGFSCTLAAAKGYGNLYKLRQKAHNRPGGCVYACPDLSKHGEAYSLTAPALVVTGIQETLI